MPYLFSKFDDFSYIFSLQLKISLYFYFVLTKETFYSKINGLYGESAGINKRSHGSQNIKKREERKIIRDWIERRDWLTWAAEWEESQLLGNHTSIQPAIG
jgi:hypothetical protein